MTDSSENELLHAVATGDERAFERLYTRYRERAGVMAWRMAHRADWIDDLLNESWCRAFDQRTTYKPEYPFLVWLAGIMRNVYRELCRRSAPGRAEGTMRSVGEGVDLESPEAIVHEAELLAALNQCLSDLSPRDAKIIRLRFFGGKTLRAVAKEVSVPESTLREVRLPALLQRIRRCMEGKKMEIPDNFPALRPDSTQLEGEDR